MDFTKLLFQYWGFKSFRPLQEEIIRSVYEGEDTLALLPTGGGKSICFQIPALAKEGICIVVTPLIALMKDQVDSLNQKGIKAVAVYSGMSNREIDVMLDNCIYGGYKFLYLSPERLDTELFRKRVQHMNVSLLTVDEAHCISQWGYDFRPSYLRIAELRELIPNVPVLALTATATPEVAKDIMQRLNFRKDNLQQRSFERKNLIYVVRHTEDKNAELLKILKSVRGSGVVYVRTRGETKEVHRLLLANNISADSYHGGMDNEIRAVKQNSWKSGQTRIMVATNAFGMGIDKPDVRLVVHMDLPDSLEAYYQEAGRAGRDGKKSYAVLLYNESDKLSIQKRVETAFPPIDEIKRIYQAIGSYLQVPIGTGKDTSYDFKMEDFSKRYKFHSLYVYSALQFLQREGYLEFSEDMNLPSRVMFLVDREELYKVQIAHPDLDLVIKTLLRAYGGIFSQYVNVSEDLIVRATNLSSNSVYEALKKLSQQKIISFLPRKKTPILTFTEDRLDDKNLRISPENYNDRKERYVQRVSAVLDYATSVTKCRSQHLVAYFGEKDGYRCGQCDVCTERNELNLSKYEFDLILSKLKQLLMENSYTINDLIDKSNQDADKSIKVVRWLLDNGKIKQDEKGLLSWA